MFVVAAYCKLLVVICGTSDSVRTVGFVSSVVVCSS